MAVTKDQLVVEVKINNEGFENKFQKSISTLSNFSSSTNESTKKVKEFEGVLDDVKDLVDSVTIAKLSDQFAKLTDVNAMLIKSIMSSNTVMMDSSNVMAVTSGSSKEIQSDLGKIARMAQQAALGLTSMTAPLQQISGDGVVQSMNLLSSDTQELSKLEGFTDLAQSADHLSGSLSDVSKQSSSLNNQLVDQSQFISQMAAAFSSTFAILDTMIRLSSGLLVIFEALTNPNTLAKLAHFADQIAMVADIKGFDQLADGVRAIGDALAYAAMKSVEFQTKFQENVERINFMIAAQDRATSLAQSSAVSLGGVLAGIGIHKVGQNFEAYKKTINPIIGMMGNFTGASERFGKVFGAMSHPLLRIVEILFMLSPALATFADKLMDSENGILKIIGTTSLLAAILGGTLGYAITFVISKISDFGVTLGYSMIDSLREAEEKFEKLQATMSQFRYTIEGLGKQLGGNVVGSFKKWHGVLDILRMTTTFATVDIAKAVKLLVAEGTRFGLSQGEIANEIVRVSDVASAYGENIVDVAQKFNAAMAGNAQSLQNMGFAVGMNNLAHSHLYQSLGRTSDALTEQELAAIRLDLIMSETTSTIGAAANETRTLAGANAILEKSSLDISAAMGSSNSFIIQMNAAYAHLIRTMAYFGEPVFEIIGAMKQFAGVTLIVTGTLFKHMIMITTVAKALDILKSSQTATSRAMGLLTTAFGFLGGQLGFTAVQVTNMSSVLTNLSKVAGALALKSMGALVSMMRTVAIGFIAASRAVLVFTASLLTNPLFLKAAAIAIAVAAVAKAIYELSQEIYFIKQALDSVFGTFSLSFSSLEKDGENAFLSFFSAVFNKINSAFKFVTDIIKLSIAGIGSIFLLLQKARLSMRAFDRDKVGTLTGGMFSFASEKDKAAIAEFEKQQDLVNTRIGDTVYVIDQTTESLGKMIGSEAQAAEGMQTIADKAKQSDSALERFVANQMRGFDESLERTMALGDQYDQLIAKVKHADMELKKAYRSTKDFDEKAKAVAEAKINLIKQEIELEKKRNEVSKSIDDQRKSLQIEQLKRNGQNIAAIKMEFDERFAALEAEEAGLKKMGKLRLEDQLIINATLRAMKAAKAASIDEERVKNLEKIKSIQEKITEIQKDNMAAGRSEIDAVNQKVEDRVRELEAIKKTFKANDDVKKQAFELLELGKKIAIENGKAAVERKRLDYLRETVAETRQLAKSSAEINALGISSLKTQNDEAIIAINNKQREAALNGLLTDQANEQFNIQRAIQGEIYEKQIDNLIRAKSIFGTHLQDMREYFSMVSDLMGISLSRMFDGLKKSLSEAIKLSKELYAKSTGGATPTDPSKFVGPPAEEKKGPVATWIKDGSDYVQGVFGSLTKSVSEMIPESVGEIASGMGEAASGLGNAYLMMFEMLMKAPQFVDMLTGLIGQILKLPENLISALKRLDVMIDRFIQSFPDAAAKFIQTIPTLLKTIVAKIPDLIINLVEELPAVIEALAEVVPELIGSLISRAPDVFAAVTKAMALGVWKLITGLITGIGNVWKGIKAPEIKVGIDAKHFAQSIAKITQDTNKVFNVTALGQAAQNAMGPVMAIEQAGRRIGRNIWNYFVQGMVDGWRWLMQAGGKIWDGLKTAAAVIGEWGTAIWEAFARGIDFIGDFGVAMWQGFLTGVGEIATTFGNWGTAIWNGLTSALGDIGKVFGAWGTAIWNGFMGMIGDSFGGFGASIAGGFSNALPAIGKAIDSLFTGLGNTFKALFKFDLSGIKTSIEGAFSAGSDIMKGAFKAVFNPMIDVINGIIEAFNGMRIPAITYGGSILGRDFGGTLVPETDLIPGELSKVARLATGGLVTGPGGVDRVPALLTAGEFVINKDAAASIGMPGLLALNSGKSQTNPTIQNISLNLTIENKDRIDENFVRQRIMPALKEELKRGSLDGRAVVYSGGVRK